jgi:hypothetical protein
MEPAQPNEDEQSVASSSSSSSSESEEEHDNETEEERMKRLEEVKKAVFRLLEDPDLWEKESKKAKFNL